MKPKNKSIEDPKNKITGDIEDLQNKEEELKNEKYVLKLYVTGTTFNSLKSIKNIKQICETYLENRYELEIIDIYQQPQLTKNDQIVAAPTLIKKLPLPLKKIIGDLSDVDNVLHGLNIKKK